MSEPPVEPPALSRRKAIAYAVGGPLLLAALLFIPAGTLRWAAGWAFIAVFFAAIGMTVLVIGRVNRARSRIQPGTKRWDMMLIACLALAIVAIFPVAANDAGRSHGSRLPLWMLVTGHVALLAGLALATWAQAVNRFFEPGVRIQTERHHQVISSGPYAFIRHPGYVGGIAFVAGCALALGSLWALVPAALAGSLLMLRTAWEDALLQAELPGYRDYGRASGGGWCRACGEAA